MQENVRMTSFHVVCVMYVKSVHRFQSKARTPLWDLTLGQVSNDHPRARVKGYYHFVVLQTKTILLGTPFVVEQANLSWTISGHIGSYMASRA